MDWGEVLQALLLLLAGSGITLLTGAIANRRRAVEVAAARELEEKRHRADLGRTHAMAARSQVKRMQTMLGFKDHEGGEYFVMPEREVEELLAEISLIPDEHLRRNASTCLTLLDSEEVYTPPSLRTGSTRGMILITLVDNLEQFIREEPIDHAFLDELAELISTWQGSDNFH